MTSCFRYFIPSIITTKSGNFPQLSEKQSANLTATLCPGPMGDLVVRKMREMHQGDVGLDGSRHARSGFEVN
jgi:hypothetical protein